MGVSGSGKTTVGRLLAARTGWPFLDADDLHSPQATAKMAAGIPLTDEDRWPWLERVAAWITARRVAGEPGVVACSSLKRAYRDLLRAADPHLRFAYLRADREVIAARLVGRRHPFFPPTLLDAQFAALEEPAEDEHPVTVSLGQSPGDEVETILRGLAAGPA